MFSAGRIPLSWLNLVHNPARLATSLLGVAFAVLLMFMFTGFKNALYDSQVDLIQKLNADLMIISTARSRMAAPATFSRQRLYQAQNFKDVAAAYPLYIQLAEWRNPVTKSIRTVRILSFNLSDPVLALPDVQTQVNQLRLADTVLIDRRSRPEVGSPQAGVITELADQRVKVVGSFELGTDFSSADGNLISSDQTFFKLLGQTRPGNWDAVDIGLIQVVPVTDINALTAGLRQSLPDDVLVLTKAELTQRERDYWQNNTNVGFVFTLLTGMGFIVGVVLVYQILYTDVADHWAEYATLKAMGYTNRYLFGVIAQESLILSALGFIPGFGASVLLYHLAINATGLLFNLTAGRVFSQFLLTLIMCLISGAIAIRKIQSTDPAEVFG
ncbi:MAG: ABC transporter permease DevC [Elainellaceae cyanobacterium]